MKFKKKYKYYKDLLLKYNFNYKFNFFYQNLIINYQKKYNIL